MADVRLRTDHCLLCHPDHHLLPERYGEEARREVVREGWRRRKGGEGRGGMEGGWGKGGREGSWEGLEGRGEMGKEDEGKGRSVGTGGGKWVQERESDIFMNALR